jgi:hypothetical protein
MAKVGPFMLAVLLKGICSVMKAPSSLMPFARLMTMQSSFVRVFISAVNDTMALEGMTRRMQSAELKIALSPVALMLVLRK